MKTSVLCLILLAVFVACKGTTKEPPGCFECGSWEKEYKFTKDYGSRDSVWMPIPCGDCVVETTISIYREVRDKRTGKWYLWAIGRQTLQEYRIKPLDCLKESKP